MEYLYPIFKDIENIRNPDYKDKFPTVPFPNKPIPSRNGKEYRRRLEEVPKLLHMLRYSGLTGMIGRLDTSI